MLINDRRSLGAGCLIALVVHAIVWAIDPHPYVMLGDSIGYLQTMLEPVPSLKAPLGYALVMFVPLQIVRDLQAIVLVQTLAALGTALLAALIVRSALRAEHERAPAAAKWNAWLPAATLLAVALWPRHVYYAHAILSECLAIFWVTAFAYLLLATARRNRDMLLAGGTLAAAVLTRSASAALLPGALAVIWFLPPARQAPLHGDELGPGGVVLRKRRRKLTDSLLLLAGAAVLLAPYAGVNRLVHGAFTVTAFDGWTLFGTVGEHVEIEKIKDPLVREVFERNAGALTTLTPSALRWSGESPAFQLDRRYRTGYEDVRVRELVGRVGLRSAVAQLWAHEEHPEVRANRALRRIAVRTVVDHPGAYVTGALSRLGAYWFGRTRYPSHFQSLAGTSTEDANFRLPKLRRLLTTRFDTDVPPRGRGTLNTLRYVAYDARIVLLLPVLVPIGVSVRRGRRDAWTRLLLGTGLLALSMSVGTCAVAEVYDRYTVVTDVLLLVCVAASVAVIARRD